MFLHDFKHIVVGILQCKFDRSLAIFGIELIGNLLHCSLTFLEGILVVITQDEGEACFCSVTLHIGQVIETLMSLGVLRGLGLG